MVGGSLLRLLLSRLSGYLQTRLNTDKSHERNHYVVNPLAHKPTIVFREH